GDAAREVEVGDDGAPVGGGDGRGEGDVAEEVRAVLVDRPREPCRPGELAGREPPGCVLDDDDAGEERVAEPLHLPLLRGDRAGAAGYEPAERRVGALRDP